MKATFQELESILGCKIEKVDKPKKQTSDAETLIKTSRGTYIRIHRKLNPLETSLVQRWIEDNASDSVDSEALILIDPKGFEQDDVHQKYPVTLWRILYKDNHEEIHEILASAFESDRIVNLNPQESVVFVTQDEMTPIELLGMLESDALTRAKIVIGNVLYHAYEVYDGYRQLVELTELSQLLREKAQIITYDTFMFPLLVNKLKRTKSSQDSEHTLLEDVLKHHIKPVGDLELEQTALIFFDNNLNISETANQLFIHRNTLIYRLNKLENITGYDIRKFNDALNYYLCYLSDKLHK